MSEYRDGVFRDCGHLQTVAPDSLVARLYLRAGYDPKRPNPAPLAYYAVDARNQIEAAQRIEQLQRERDKEKVRADAYNEKFQKQCEAVDEESHRAMMAESRLACITQAADAMREAYQQVRLIAGFGRAPMPDVIEAYDAIRHTTEG